VTVLTLQALGAARLPFEGERFRMLPARVQKEMASRAVDWGVANAVAEIRRRRPHAAIHGFGDLSQQEQQTVADSVSSALAPILGSTLKSTTANVSSQAAAVIGPVIEEKLAAYGPTFAVIMGLVAATLTLLGMAVFGGYILTKIRR
jgi:hypothetical protein